MSLAPPAASATHYTAGWLALCGVVSKHTVLSVLVSPCLLRLRFCVTNACCTARRWMSCLPPYPHPSVLLWLQTAPSFCSAPAALSLFCGHCLCWRPARPSASPLPSRSASYCASLHNLLIGSALVIGCGSKFVGRLCAGLMHMLFVVLRRITFKPAAQTAPAVSRQRP